MGYINYTIYQLKTIATDYAFRSWEEAERHNFSLDDYKIVYKGEEPENKHENIVQLLESLYCKFNINRPCDFYGHSLSMSDIVKIGDDFFYCDEIGWKKITKYILDEVVA